MMHCDDQTLLEIHEINYFGSSTLFGCAESLDSHASVPEPGSTCKKQRESTN